LEAAEITGIACCTVLICVLLVSYYKRKQYARKTANTPVPTGGQTGAESAVLPTSMIQEPVIAAPVADIFAPAPADPMVVILKLKGLLDVGAITQKEFDMKKANLLAQI
jgi:hypothetical protein